MGISDLLEDSFHRCQAGPAVESFPELVLRAFHPLRPEALNVQESNVEAAQNAMLTYRSIVRLWLNVLDGYECQVDADFPAFLT